MQFLAGFDAAPQLRGDRHPVVAGIVPQQDHFALQLAQFGAALLEDRGVFRARDLRVHGLEVLADVENRLNNRPRKILGWATPAEIFTRAIA